MAGMIMKRAKALGIATADELRSYGKKLLEQRISMVFPRSESRGAVDEIMHLMDAIQDSDNIDVARDIDTLPLRLKIVTQISAWCDKLGDEVKEEVRLRLLRAMLIVTQQEDTLLSNPKGIIAEIFVAGFLGYQYRNEVVVVEMLQHIVLTMDLAQSNEAKEEAKAIKLMLNRAVFDFLSGVPNNWSGSIADENSYFLAILATLIDHIDLDFTVPDSPRTIRGLLANRLAQISHIVHLVPTSELERPSHIRCINQMYSILEIVAPRDETSFDAPIVAPMEYISLFPEYWREVEQRVATCEEAKTRPEFLEVANTASKLQAYGIQVDIEQKQQECLRAIANSEEGHKYHRLPYCRNMLAVMMDAPDGASRVRQIFSDLAKTYGAHYVDEHMGEFLSQSQVASQISKLVNECSGKSAIYSQEDAEYASKAKSKEVKSQQRIADEILVAIVELISSSSRKFEILETIVEIPHVVESLGSSGDEIQNSLLAVFSDLPRDSKAAKKLRGVLSTKVDENITLRDKLIENFRRMDNHGMVSLLTSKRSSIGPNSKSRLFILPK